MQIAQRAVLRRKSAKDRGYDRTGPRLAPLELHRRRSSQSHRSSVEKVRRSLSGDDDMAALIVVVSFFEAVLRQSRGRTRRLSATLVVSATMIAVTSPPINHSFPRGLTYNSYYSPFTGIAVYGCGRRWLARWLRSLIRLTSVAAFPGDKLIIDKPR